MRLSFAQILRRSLLHRRARSLSALVALTVSAAVATALLTLYADLDQKLHHTFRGFGANVVVTGQNLTPALITRAQQAAGPDANLAAFAYAVVQVSGDNPRRGTPVVAAGVDFAQVRRLDTWWQVSVWPSAPTQALIGQRATASLSATNTITLTYAGQSQAFPIAGNVKTGGDEDSRIYLPLAAFEQWTGVQPSVLEIQIPGDEARINQTIQSLKQALPGTDVEPVRQLVEGESRIVDRTHALMAGAVILIALTVAVSVLATLSASILERRRDFALMKALGGSERTLTALFLAETILLALGGVFLGWLVGSFAAWAISELDFGTAALPRIGVVPAVLLLNGIIAGLAALLPLRSLRGLEPAALLKGE